MTQNEIDWTIWHGVTPSTPEVAERICDLYNTTLDALLQVIDKEHDELIEGRIEQALIYVDDKQKYGVDFARATDLVRNNLVAITRFAPGRASELKERQLSLLEKLQENARLISMLRMLSEQFLRGVAQDVRSQTALEVYGKSGKAEFDQTRSGLRPIIMSTQL